MTMVESSAPGAWRLRRLPEAAVGLAAGLWLVLLWAWPNAAFYLSFDDSFYYFEIARNLAAGLGPTFDRLNPTNGFHPLWLAIATLPYLGGLDGLTAVRVLLGLGVVLWGATLVMIVGRLRGPGAGTLALVTLLLGANPYVIKTFANGLESALYALLLAALVGRSMAVGGDWIGGASRRQRLIAGALGAVAFLARTDAIFALAALALTVAPGALRKRRPMALVELFALPAAVVVVFLAANAIVFGTPMQVSGTVKRLPLGPLAIALFIGLTLVLAGAAWWLARRAERVPLPRTAALLRSAPWFPLACGMILGYYVALQSFPRLWHFAPVVLLGVALFLALTADLAGLAGPSRRLLAVILAGPLALAAVLHGLRLADPATVAARLADRRAAEWIAVHLPAEAVLGSWDAGILGYFTPQRVINLDGVVNSPAYAAALARGEAGALVRAQGLAYLVNHDDTAGDRPRALPAMAGWLLGAETAGAMRLVKTWPFTFAGSSNRRARGRHSMAVFLYALPAD